jgi:hypothetical protein
MMSEAYVAPIVEIKAKKRQAEKEIDEILERLSKETGLLVTDIVFRSTPVHSITDDLVGFYHVEIEMTV